MFTFVGEVLLLNDEAALGCGPSVGDEVAHLKILQLSTPTFDHARYLLIKKSIRFQGSEPSGGVGLSRRAHMISRVRIRARGIECFGGDGDDRASCVAQAIVADRTDQQSAEPNMLPSSDNK
jgi:hypothetical protein